tara:strand:+ start:1359 stop:1508 length:150 start_codon:yes stop_codon:yes gene_type:complete
MQKYEKALQDKEKARKQILALLLELKKKELLRRQERRLRNAMDFMQKTQ